MRNPDFLIVGAPRSGTTAMYEYLKQHPDIFMPTPKTEPHFFATDLNYCQAYAPFREPEAYAALFEDAGEAQLVGEASVLYLYSKTAASMIARSNPKTKIIIMLRNPVDMIYSLHGKLLLLADENIADFHMALKAEDDRKKGRRIPPNMSGAREVLFYREVGRYAEQVGRYLEVFGRDNVATVIFDDFKSRTLEVYREVLFFLGVDPNFIPEITVVNRHKQVRSQRLNQFARHLPEPIVKLSRTLLSDRWRQSLRYFIERLNTRNGGRQPMDGNLRMQLQNEFAEDLLRLSNLIGRDLTWWT